MELITTFQRSISLDMSMSLFLGRMRGTTKRIQWIELSTFVYQVKEKVAL